jgi:hypothetical protein
MSIPAGDRAAATVHVAVSIEDAFEVFRPSCPTTTRLATVCRGRRSAE